MPTDPATRRRFGAAEDGAAAVVVALCLTVLFGFVALGVDIAALARERAQLQARSDLVALGVAAGLRAPEERLAVMLDRNGLPAGAVGDVTYGRYLRNPALPRDARFTPLDPGDPRINAVALRLDAEAPLYFASVLAAAEATRIAGAATATRTEAVGFSLEARLARLSPQARARALSAGFGVALPLTPAEDGLLASAEVDAGALLAALAVETGFSGANPADLLVQEATGAQVMRALRAVAPTALGPVLGRLPDPPGLPRLPVAGLVAGDAGLGLTLTGFLDDTRLPVLGLLGALADAAARAAEVDLAVDTVIPGVLAVDAALRLGPATGATAVARVAEPGDTLHAAAGTVTAAIEIDPARLGPLGAAVVATRLRLPVTAELGGVTATLLDRTCSARDPADIVARFATARAPLAPAAGGAVAAVYIGTLPDGAAAGPIDPASLGFADLLDVSIRIDLPLLPDLVIERLTLQVRGAARVGQPDRAEVAFTLDQWQRGAHRRTFGSDALIGSAIATALGPGGLELRVKPEHQGLVSGPAAPVVAGLLAALPDQLMLALAGPLDAAVDASLAAAGLTPGSGALTLLARHCEPPALVE
ncbi:TadG family pilus assembly protein [Roseicyclus persicicus]|uniref:DUF2134 domain-containing protein n=1 Tax=Roseicyclus persicicus TaxID=2650661 RepID=A0A7X6H0T6_9RHOB|nr:TadG family pilus assembly protein [Roseibacterium persicicum]NKX45939.1 hypothetical protein [Roseibacterium persicicum]